MARRIDPGNTSDEIKHRFKNTVAIEHDNLALVTLFLFEAKIGDGFRIVSSRDAIVVGSRGAEWRVRSAAVLAICRISQY